MKDKELVGEFLRRFYDICSTPDCFNYTLDEFYDDFPVEMILASKFTQLPTCTGSLNSIASIARVSAASAFVSFKKR